MADLGTTPTSGRDEVTSLVVDELARRLPLTERQLHRAVELSGETMGLADLRRLLESRGEFVLAGDRPRCWRLAQPSDAATEICAACGLEKSTARFRSTSGRKPTCFDCEAHGLRPQRSAPPPKFEWPRHFVDGRARTGVVARQAGGHDAYLDGHEGLVFITRGGSVYHLREDCEAMRNGQAQAVGMGLHLHKVRLVPRSQVIGTRRACARCAM